MPDAGTLLSEVRRRLQAGEGFALATINLDHLVKLARDPGFRAVYAAQDLVCADGNPIVWLSKLARKPVSLVPGSDMILPLAQQAARAGVPVALMGSTGESLAAAAVALNERVSGLQILAAIAPPMGFDPTGEAARAILHQIDASGARLVFVALGAPKQEAFAAFGREVTPGIGFASIGAGLDFISGRQNRAPDWVKAIAMEWLWRMLSNPRRLAKRYLDCALILPGQAINAFRQR
ncbi:WecB/TagA/CpsF family glycosyltransferase [Pararhodobacter zhoushanensis]|uniref:WecB/TagA/CpsF family glycosyltransferase n=2 Tax=Pararhodobacter zhoushanensis TaxID=2479545 RepID=A0ABT3GUM9_9RHOB|nr:WecB/TagA/CpsF family glycosyltransferase [Pararhodobacter zhoushanensis]MCW1931256.1 WecB/TagA/CpsF family glycosyltransferase [Pararhodobacter zhoushanensis]